MFVDNPYTQLSPMAEIIGRNIAILKLPYPAGAEPKKSPAIEVSDSISEPNFARWAVLLPL